MRISPQESEDRNRASSASSKESWRFYAGWLLPATAAMTWLALALPPYAFYSGDPGLKLMAALSTIEHPNRPFELELPRIGGRHVDYLDPMIVRHSDHAHVLQSPIFPWFRRQSLQSWDFAARTFCLRSTFSCSFRF
jgi:hypothetical protein